MPGECVYQRTRGNIPQTDGSVVTRTCDCVTIWTERYAIDKIRMPGEQCHLLIVGRIIKPNTDTTRHRKTSPIRRILYLTYSPFTKPHFSTVGQPPLRVILGGSVEWKDYQKHK